MWFFLLIVYLVLCLPISLCSRLDSELQKALKEYLIAKGIGVSLTNFLLHYLHTREQGQYVNWLKKCEAFVAKDEPLNQSSEIDST